MDTLNLPVAGYLQGFSHHPEELIPLLQRAQAEVGYLSPGVVRIIANHLRITESQVFSVASFYSQFRFTPKGRHSITICLGTACHVRGGEILLKALERELEVETGRCTADGRFDINRVACLGCCALAPVIKVDEDVYSNMTVIKIKDVLARYE